MDAVGIWYVFRLLNLKLSRNPLKVYYMRYDLYSIQCSLRLFGAGYMDAVGIWSLFHPVQLTFIRGRLHGCCWYLIAIPSRNPLKVYYMRYDLYSIQCSLRLFGAGYMDAVGIWYVFRLLNLKLSRNPLKVFYMRYDRYSIQEPPEGVLHEIRSLFHPVQLTFIRGRLHGCCWYLIAIPCHEICCMHNQLIWFVWSVFQCSLSFIWEPVTWMLLVSDMFSDYLI